jgi:uncharacterized protein YfaS (alpha-2-macroglobulin family)
MKSRLAILLLSVAAFSAAAVLVTVAQNAARTPQWKEVDDAVRKGRPKTAIEKIEPIIAKALKEKRWAEAINGIGRKIALEGTIQGNKPEEKIVRLEAEIAKAPAEMKPAMNAILAHWYWQYFQANRYRFLQRTQTAAPPGKDFQTWDLTRLFAEIDKKLVTALAASDSLKKIPVGDFEALLVKGNVPDSYRPTMYDFVAHEALAFYNSGEQAAAKSQDAFDLSADSPVFSDAAQFLAWKPESTDEDSPKLKAIQLYQALLNFHAEDDDQSAWLDVDLLRLNFGNNYSFGEEKTARYKAALKRFAESNNEHQISSRALHHLATVVQGEGELVEARKIALQGKNSFPASVGGRRCHNLIEEIESPTVQITTERVWNNPLPTVDVRYKNLTKVYFRVVEYDWDKRLASRGNRRPDYLDQNERKALIRQKPVVEWSVDLPATEDYHQAQKEVPARDDLEPGSYFLLSSHQKNFGANNNRVHFADFWVSDLALVIRNRNGQGVIEGFVLDNESGEPIVEANVRAWRAERTNWQAAGKTTTDENGFFTIRGVDRKQLVLHARHKDQALSTGNYYYTYQQDQRAKPYTRTMFFTDRSLYRPGQTIHFKGLCIDVKAEQDNYKVLPNTNVTVIFQDPNGKEIARQKHKSNDYGSFNGSFTAPRDRLMGRMSLRVDGNPQGYSQVTVEEYKRPKFQVELAAPKEGGRLNGDVSLTGKAKAYTGAAIDAAKVKWRVVREVRYPYWYSYRYWWYPRPNTSQEIAHGTSETSVDGTFNISFNAKPDVTVPEKHEPTFHFSVYADVTDTNGETRSDSQIVRLGYTALQASVTAENWQTTDKPVDITIRTTTLDGEPQAAKGTVKVYSLKQPEKVARAPLRGRFTPRFGRGAKLQAPRPDPTNVTTWGVDEVVGESKFETDTEGNAKLTFKLPAGPFRVKLETQDRFGKPVSGEHPVQVLDTNATKLAIKLPHLFRAPTMTLEPGKEFSAIWGTGYDKARAFVEIEHRRKVIRSFWTKPNVTQIQIKQEITEAMRGGFTVRVTMVRENRAYLTAQKVNVPWSNKNLSVKWEHFVSKLKPAQKETWTAIITGPDATKAVAEMVAGLYDASLDAYLPHQWQQHFNVFRQDHSNVYPQFENQQQYLQYIHGTWPRSYRQADMRYRMFPQGIIASLWGYQFFDQPNQGVPGFQQGSFNLRGRRMLGLGGAFDSMAMAANGAAPMEAQQEAKFGSLNRKQAGFGGSDKKAQGGSASGGPDLSKVAARSNLNETAFFFPHLISDKDGEVKLEFEMPEALTEWKFQGFAHDKDLRGGFIQDTVVTAKELMIQPNPPRFVREGDELEFTVKVTNQSPTQQSGTVRLSLADARTGKAADTALGNLETDLSFEVPSKESRSFSWRISVPDDMGFLTYKAVGSTGRLSDGEEGHLPVLSRRILVTESLPLPIRGAQTKKFNFKRLIDSGESDTLKHQSLTVQMVSNPSWYAVMALPYLMEYPHQCSEQTFNRLYANALARHIANSDPEIRRVFDIWKNTPGDTLDSPLEKNQDLKAVMLEETPWLRQSNKEGQARRNVGILFDANRLNEETARTLRKLAEMQYEDGSWPWFPGGPSNDYITLYITTGFGRMRHLGVEVDMAPAVKSLTRLDGWIKRIYDRIKNKNENHMSTTIALYLYSRTFFLEDKPVAAEHKVAFDYFVGQAKKYWLKLANRQSQAHLAVALNRLTERQSARAIMASIDERSVEDEELGRFWRDTERSWWWYRAPVETQAMMIEAFDEVMNDQETVEACKVWLLKQKQTQDWKTTKATADAVYALLLRGSDLLASTELVEVSLGGEILKPENVEAGTGFYEKSFIRAEVQADFGKVKLKKVDKGVAWGSLHWQYLEDVSKVTSYEGTPLKLTKSLWIKENTRKGPVLKPVKGALAVGDELVVRITLNTDRSMEYIHLKDQRGSGTEPVNVLSKYKYQDGLYYYESTRDTASHFFIDYLPKGTYVFEYSVRIQHRGSYQTGMAQIQCMYAPEFNSHSESFRLEVK